MYDLIIGFLLGVLLTIVASPLIIKWYLKRKIKKITGEYL